MRETGRPCSCNGTASARVPPPPPNSWGLGDLALLPGFSSPGQNEEITKVLWQPGLLVPPQLLPGLHVGGGAGESEFWIHPLFLPPAGVSGSGPWSPTGRKGWVNEGRSCAPPPNPTCILKRWKERNRVRWGYVKEYSGTSDCFRDPCYIWGLSLIRKSPSSGGTQPHECSA